MMSTRQSDLGLPAARELGGGALEPARLVDERPAAAIEHLADRGQHGLATLQLEDLHAEQVLELLDGVGDRGLGAVQPARGLRIAARLDDRDERVPLVERNTWLGHISTQ